MEMFFGLILLIIIMVLSNPLLTKIENSISNIGKKKKD
jgi:hypothetical protein